MLQWERRKTEEITAILTWRNMLCLSTMPAFLSCLFSETWARNNSQVHLFSSVPWVVAVFSFQQGLLSFFCCTFVISSLLYWRSFLYHLEMMQNLVVSFQWRLAWYIFCLCHMICSESQFVSVRESVWCFQPKSTVWHKTHLNIKAWNGNEHGNGVWFN